jgi:hypothetical protein
MAENGYKLRLKKIKNLEKVLYIYKFNFCLKIEWKADLTLFDSVGVHVVCGVGYFTIF